MGLHKHICNQCGVEFENYFESAKYCSHVCYDLYRKENSKCKDIECPVCGKIFHQHKPGVKYCSPECRHKASQNRVVCTCDYCGKTFERIVSEYNKREQHFCSKECRKSGLGWNKKDTEILKENYGKMSYEKMMGIFTENRTLDSIKNRAIYLGLTSPRDWSEDELSIFNENYSKIPTKDLLELLPKRTLSSIHGMARKNNLLSYYYLKKSYSDEEENYIRENYLSQSNEELGEALGRSPNGIAQHLWGLGLFRPKEYGGYKNLSEYVRSRLTNWRDDYKASQNYTCALTGLRSNIVVHHIRGFNLILNEAISNLSFPIYDSMSHYSEEQLNELYNEYIRLQEFYGLYVCVNEDVHKDFHGEYGYGNNTETQWNEFVNKYYS